MKKDEWGPLGPPQGDWMDWWKLFLKPTPEKKEPKQDKWIGLIAALTIALILLITVIGSFLASVEIPK